MEAVSTFSEAGPSNVNRGKTKRICGICMDEKPLSDLVFVNGCSHGYCSRCVSIYVSGKVNENVTVIRCPHVGCGAGSFDPEICKPILAREVFEQWCLCLCVCTIKNKFYCPFKDCSALLSDDGGNEVIREAECPHCHRLFCAQCKSPWHSELACEDFQNLVKDEKVREDVIFKDLAKEKGWSRCPLCHFYVEKLSGCSTMKCRCGHIFCYGCGTTMTRDHYCAICKV